MEFTLLGAGLIAMAALWATLRLAAARPEAADLGNIAVGAVVVGMLTGRVWAMLAAGTNPIGHPTDLLIVRGGVDTLGASLGALAALAWSLRSDLRRLDLIAPAALAGIAGWHAGCLVRGSCLGTATGLPWGITADGSTIPRHPVEVYAFLALVVAVVVVARWVSRRPGVRFGTALALASLIRLATEPLRVSLRGGMTAVYALGVAVGAVVVIVAHWRARSPE